MEWRGAQRHGWLRVCSGLLAVFLSSPVTVRGAWFEEARLIASPPTTFPADTFGQSVSLDADTALVGIPNDDDGGINSGSAYVFVRSGGLWTEQATFAASDATAGDLFGGSVSLDGDTALVAAAHDDDDGMDSGSAYVFVRSGGVWTE